jgi:hypothetical protein
MAKKFFTDESLTTLVSEVKSYVNNAVSTKANSSHKHNVTDINGLTATVEELNHMDGVTSNVQTQLDTMTEALADKVSASELTREINSASTTVGQFGGVAYGAGKFVALPYSYADDKSKFAYSSDGETWAFINAPSTSVQANWKDIIYANGKFVTIGNATGSGGEKYCAVSTDGINWTVGDLPTGGTPYSLAYGNGRYVMVGSNTVSAYSTDGLNWTRVLLPSSCQAMKVAFGNGMFVAPNPNGYVCAYSTDGSSWTMGDIVAGEFSRIVFGNGRFVSVGNNAIHYSDDGVNWTFVTSPITANWYALAYGEGYYVALGYNKSTYIYSTDGITWQTATAPVTDYWCDVEYGNGKFIAVTEGGQNFLTIYFSGNEFGLAYESSIPSIEGLATEEYVNTRVTNLVNSAPETLDTLNELAAALGNDENFATTISTQIGNKVDKVEGMGLSSNDFTTEEKEKLAGVATNLANGSAVGSVRSIGASAESDTYVMGQYAFAEGNRTKSSGNYSHSEGYGSEASGTYSHSEGIATKAQGFASHAEGNSTVSSGSYAHSEGFQTLSNGKSSHTEGHCTVSTASSSNNAIGQHVQGRFNLEDTDGVYAHIVGNGKGNNNTTYDYRSNAHTVDWSGNAWYQGDIYIGSTSGTNKDEGSKKVATEEYVNNQVAAIPTPDVSGQISTHNTSTSAHNDIRDLITGLTTRLNTLADSDDTTLDQMSEIVTYIKSNKSLIDSVTTNKVNVSDIINNLTTNVTNKPLSAAQGVALKGLIDELNTVLDTKVPTSRTINGKALSANITLSASDVGALPSTTPIPSITGLATETYVNNKVSGKQDTISGGASTITSSNLTANRVLISNGSGKVAVSAVTSTKLGYLDGVTSNIQTQLGEKSTATNLVNGSANFSLRGINTKAEGSTYTIDEETFTYTIGRSAFAEGSETIASGMYSHAEGYKTITSGIGSHAEGDNTIASGKYSHAEGSETIASGMFSHAEGYKTITTNTAQHVEGIRNIKDTENIYAHIIGNGYYRNDVETFSNAHTVDWNGNAWYQGDIYVGSTSGTNKDSGSKKVATEEYVDNRVTPIEKGGTGQTSIADTTYTTARYRASSLHSTETTPSVNGVIAWKYE